MSFSKYFLISINFVVWIASVVVLGLALFIYIDIKDVVNLFPGVELQMLPLSAIAAGCALFIISFSGCCGAIKEWKWMLCMYLGFLLLIIGAEAYFTYVVMEFRSNGGNHLVKVKHWVDAAFKNHDNFWALENLLHCCGSNNATDYDVLDRIPPRCCDKPAMNTCLAQDAYDGCGQVFADYIDYYSKYAGYGMIAVGIFELMAVVAALIMICTKKNAF